MKFDQAKIDAFKLESGAIVTIQELLRGRDADFDAAKTVRLVRHADNREKKLIEGKPFEGSLYQLYRFDKPTFLKYQKEQNRSRIEKVDYIVSFIGEKGTTARFVGVYKVGNKVDSPYIHGDMLCDMDIVAAFESLTHRIVIEWGKSAKTWCQDYETQIKSVIRIDEGFEDENGVPRFQSYTQTILPYEKLRAIFIHDDQEWKTVLKAVNGIYLIQDMCNGKQYVGKTSGRNGIWGRWEEYFKTGGHGNNVKLVEKINEDAAYAHNFQWTILETLPINVTDGESSFRETLYKEKFLTRKFGYNEN